MPQGVLMKAKIQPLPQPRAEEETAAPAEIIAEAPGLHNYDLPEPSSTFLKGGRGQTQNGLPRALLAVTVKSISPTRPQTGIRPMALGQDERDC
jgi:hypothetical protein